MGFKIKQTAHTPELEALLLSMPGFFDLAGNRCTVPQLLEEKIPAQTPNGPITDFKTDSRWELSDTPTCFGSPAFDSPLPWHSFIGFKELSEILQYQFSDGRIVPVGEILNDPYSAFVPLSLLPLISKIRPEAQRYSWLKLTHEFNYPSWVELRQAELCVISILLSASQHIQNSDSPSPFKILLTDSQDRDQKRQGFLLRLIGLVSSSQSSWQLTPLASPSGAGRAILSFVESLRTPSGKVFYSFEISPEKQCLWFHPFHEQISLVRSTLAQIGNSEVEELPQQLKLMISGHHKIRECIEKVDHALLEKKYPAVEHPSIHPLGQSDIEPHLWMSSQGKLQFARKIQLPDGDHLIWNFSPRLLRVLKGLWGGLHAACEDSEYAGLARDRMGMKRDRDSKMLKHVGLYALLLLETLNYGTTQKSLEGIPIATLGDFLTYLHKKLGTVLSQLERKAGFVDLSPALPADKVCSRGVIELIQKHVEDLSVSSMGISMDAKSLFTPTPWRSNSKVGSDPNFK